MDTEFRCLALTPADWGDPAIAIAVARAGGVGLLDLEFSRDAPTAENAIRRLLAECSEGCIGFRLGAGPIEFPSLLAEIANRTHWLILPAQTGDLFAKLCSQLPRSTSRILLAEVTTQRRPLRSPERKLPAWLPAVTKLAAGLERIRLSFYCKNYSLTRSFQFMYVVASDFTPQRRAGELAPLELCSMTSSCSCPKVLCRRNGAVASARLAAETPGLWVSVAVLRAECWCVRTFQGRKDCKSWPMKWKPMGSIRTIGANAPSRSSVGEPQTKCHGRSGRRSPSRQRTWTGSRRQDA